MSLATRCTACGTVFRVVEDQLKVSEGWVRCGRCQQVFNAVESLFDLEREAPPPWTPPASAGPAPATEPAAHRREAAPPAAPPHGEAEASADSAPVDLLLDLPDEHAHDASGAGSLFDALIDGRPTNELPVSTGDVDIDIESVSVRNESTDPVDILLDDAAVGRADAPYRLTRQAAPAAPSTASPAAETGSASLADAPFPAMHADDDDERAGPPTFMLDADRAQRWRRSPLRLALSIGSVVLALALLVQIALHFRDTLAAAWPEARGTLAGLCSVAGCKLQPPHRIDSVSVESSGLTRSADGTGYRLSVVLLNKAAYGVAIPAIDLSLTDTAGQVIARRVLKPEDFRAAPESLKPSGVTTLEAGLVIDGKPVAGYAIEIFYP